MPKKTKYGNILQFAKEDTQVATFSGNIYRKQVAKFGQWVNPDYPWFWIIQEGADYTKAGENLIFVESVTNNKSVHSEFLDMWMESPSHKAAILNPKYSYIGIGTCYDPSPFPTTYAVQHFTGY